MLTPAFDLCQDADFLTIVIKVPYAKVSEFDVYYEGEDFKFYAKPYFLRLTLPGRIVEDGREKASYNIDEGAFTIKLPKETPGQHFEGLGMLTALLAQKGSRSAKPLVEELDAPTEPEEDDDDFDWQIEQTPFEENDAALNSQCSYGFGNLRSGVFGRLQDELSDVIDVKNPDVTPAEERQEARMAAEDAKFDPDHYLADLFEDDAVQHMLKYKSWWADACPRRTSPDGRSTPEQDSQETLVSFTDDEKRKLRNFKNKSFLLDKQARHQALLSLIDIILAYCYEVRVTEGEHNVESSWNIRKLSGTLAWLQSYSSVHDVTVSFGRRVLCYSLHRHFKLVESSVKDAIKLLQMGKAAVLKCLLDIHCIFQENDPAYILNDLYITDYCIWIQKVKSKRLTALAECLQTTTLTKADLGFELEEVELAARLVQEEEKQAVASSTVSRQLLLSSEVEASDSDESSSASSSETEDSDTEETDSDDEELSDSEDVKITCSQDGLQEKGKGKALLLEGNRLIQDSDAAAAQDTDVGKSDSSLQTSPVSAHLVEELGEKLRTAVVLSEQSEELELVTEMDRDLQEASTSYAHGRSKHLVEELGEKLRTAVVLSEQSEELELVTEMDRDLQEASTSCAHGPSKHVEDCNKCGHFLDVSHKKNPLLIVSDYKDEDDKANLLESV